MELMGSPVESWQSSFFLSFLSRRITSKPPELEPCRIGLATGQRNALLFPSEVEIPQPGKKTENWKPVALQDCLPKCLFNVQIGLLFKPYLGASKGILTQTEALGTIKIEVHWKEVKRRNKWIRNSFLCPKATIKFPLTRESIFSEIFR